MVKTYNKTFNYLFTNKTDEVFVGLLGYKISLKHSVSVIINMFLIMCAAVKALLMVDFK